ncbi:hypothetical protein TNIN_289981 [Trichonephila inaurata madagascariensis]|uniref:Uncharacterized protein n=1 Tax=Trichonephila inaurata madagascariensis TaxID=2747483 RepID=A0A8X6X645_9ARAC|nr:hypothetical protein TNIN_289981 [Trichonephila inaurata madagascariensis]
MAAGLSFSHYTKCCGVVEYAKSGFEERNSWGLFSYSSKRLQPCSTHWSYKHQHLAAILKIINFIYKTEISLKELIRFINRRSITAGVMQGFILSSTLSNIYIYDTYRMYVMILLFV